MKANVCLKPENHFADFSACGQVLMKWIVKKKSVRVWAGIK